MIVGWKSIAATLNVSVRTAQRLRVVGLPVANLTPRTVFVRGEALSEWLARRDASWRDAALDGAVSGVAGDRT